MMNHPSPYALGATLYMPATRSDICDVILHNKIPGLRSLVICLEDAVAEKDVPKALDNLKVILQTLYISGKNHDGPLVFIRPRDESMGADLVANFNLSTIDGFVLPKFTLMNLPIWSQVLSPTHLLWMPTLETEDVFDAIAMRKLALALDDHPCRNRILALRIGGNDLMNVLALRRSRNTTLYEGALGYVFKMLVCTFSSKGFSLTAPVCELIDDVSLLERELMQDVEHGLVGKTVIHPSHISMIHSAFSVDPLDHEDALRILNSEAAVFKNNGAMCEPATHRRWAKSILTRAKHYGIKSQVANLIAQTN